jgi:DNA topoisomerase-1
MAGFGTDSGRIRSFGFVFRTLSDAGRERRQGLVKLDPFPLELSKHHQVPFQAERNPLFDSKAYGQSIVDPRDAAEYAGLRYVSDARPGIGRRRLRKGFIYLRPDGVKLSDGPALCRIQALAIPPAWRGVWICPFVDGHIQATGRDARGRKQYRYHARFREVRESTKFDHVFEFADALPAIREKVSQHMALRGLPREKVLATVVHLLETTLIRVGNGDYAKQNNSYGLTTLKNRHVAVEGAEVRFRFTGKSGKQWSLRVKDRRVAKIIRACQELPGQELLQYMDEEANPRDVTSSDVNGYLKEITGKDITAKDFRTWAGTVLAAMALCEVKRFDSAAHAKRNLRAAIEKVAARLGNTPAICRKCYVHPEVLSSYMDGNLMSEITVKAEGHLCNAISGLKPEEAAVLAMLRRRLPTRAAGPPIDFLPGFVNQDDKTPAAAGRRGGRQARRPLVADDVGNAAWRPPLAAASKSAGTP